MRFRLTAFCLAIVCIAGVAGGRAAAATGPLPRIAIYGFNSQGLQQWWGGVGGFDPGDALADVMTDKMVNSGQYNIVDRSHTDQILAEQNLSRSGDVAPSTEAKLGRMLGANYLIFGRIVQFDKTGGSNAGVGGLLRNVGGGILGGAGLATEKVTLSVTMRVVEVNTGRLAASVKEEESKTGNSFSLTGFNWQGAGTYQSSEFTSSTVGKLLTSVAEALADKIDPAKLATSNAAPSMSARVLAVDGSSVIINAGENKGVTVGSDFDVLQTKELHDPDSGKMLVSHSKVGSIEIVSVDKETAVGKLIDGIAKVGLSVSGGGS